MPVLVGVEQVLGEDASIAEPDVRGGDVEQDRPVVAGDDGSDPTADGDAALAQQRAERHGDAGDVAEVADVVVADGTGTSVARRPGGYAGYEEQRRAVRSSRRTASVGRAPAVDTSVRSDDESPATETGRRTQVERSSRPAAKGKSSPTHLRNKLRAAEREVSDLSAELDATSEALRVAAESGDHVALNDLGAALTAVGARLETAEEQWLELAAEVEERGLQI
mgnify:CR=1 FL=1